MTEARKLYFRVMLGPGSKNRTPHSLGKCIEWKPATSLQVSYAFRSYSPHSLGKCIEWKLVFDGIIQHNQENQLPTRWGNVLSGNISWPWDGPSLDK